MLVLAPATWRASVRSSSPQSANTKTAAMQSASSEGETRTGSGLEVPVFGIAVASVTGFVRALMPEVAGVLVSVLMLMLSVTASPAVLRSGRWHRLSANQEKSGRRTAVTVGSGVGKKVMAKYKAKPRAKDRNVGTMSWVGWVVP